MQPRFRRNAIIVLVVFTALVHLAAAFDGRLFEPGTTLPDPLFALNGLGFLGLLGAYFLPIPFFQERHKIVWWMLFSYICVTLVAWLVIWVGFNVIRDGKPFFGPDSLYGVPAKISEITLLYLLKSDKP